MPRSKKHDKALLHLREVGLAYPEAHTKSPWPGHLDLAVNDKTFAYLSLEGQPLSVGCKLPDSSAQALALPGAKPTAYGLGKWGWVSIQFETSDAIPVEMLEAWLEESYRAQAPKRLVKLLDGASEAKPAKKKSAKTKSAKKKPAKNTSR